MATKVYLSGTDVIVDQDNKVLLTIRQNRAKYTLFYTSCSVDGIDDHVSNSIEFFDITGGEGRAELITGIQDQAGTPILGDDNIKKYLSFFLQSDSKAIVFCDKDPPFFLEQFTGNGVKSLNVSEGEKGTVKSIVGYGGGNVVFVIDGTNPNNNSPKILDTGEFRSLENIILSDFRAKGTAGAARYYITYTITS